MDDVYRVNSAGRVSTDRAFLLFACEVGQRFDKLVLFGRTPPGDGEADYMLPAGVELERLPHYGNLKHLGEVARATLGTARAIWRGLDRLDVVWLFGPHPFELLAVAIALLRRRTVVLGVRQDTVEYARQRLASTRWARLGLAGVRVMDAVHRRLARRLPATLVGPQIAARYASPGTAAHLTMTVSLVPAAAVAEGPHPDPGNPVRLLTVGRLESEKNPLLLVDALAQLNRRSPARYELTWIGRGELEGALRARAADLGVAHLLEVRGYVPFGDELLGFYRRADVFVHVSRTEGLPQVLIEALASATPIVATDVGAVGEALAGGRAGLLVPPDDVAALAEAVTRLVDDAALRRRLVETGLELGRSSTFEAESARVADFITAATAR